MSTRLASGQMPGYQIYELSGGCTVPSLDLAAISSSTLISAGPKASRVSVMLFLHSSPISLDMSSRSFSASCRSVAVTFPPEYRSSAKGFRLARTVGKPRK